MGLLNLVFADPYRFPAFIFFICSAAFYLFFGQRAIALQREWLPPWLLLPRGRRSSASKTPPRSVSPEKKVPNNGPSPVDYQDIFPPSSRSTLATVLEDVPAERREHFYRGEIPEAEFRKGQIPLEADFRTCGPSTYTAMGWSIGEIRALGDFPSYAKLSGVPLPQAYTECKVEKAIPRPYRPFRWAYHQTMCGSSGSYFSSHAANHWTQIALTKLESDWWLELESHYKVRVAERKELVARHGTMVLDYLPGAELACKEVMEMALQFYCARYPQYFSLSFSESEGYVFHNRILDTDTVISSMHPLHVLLNNVPEDFAIMLRSPEDGKYYLRGGVLCSALGWNIGTKIGMQLKEIHSPIPDYKEKMEFSMDRYIPPFMHRDIFTKTNTLPPI